MLQDVQQNLFHFWGRVHNPHSIALQEQSISFLFFLIQTKKSKKEAATSSSLSFAGSRNERDICESIKYKNDGYTVIEAQKAATVYKHVYLCACVPACPHMQILYNTIYDR